MAQNAAKEMSFWDHLEALRQCIFRSAAALLVVSIVLFFFKGFLFDGIILAPTRSDFFLYRLLGVDVSLKLVNIEVAAQFLIHMKATFMCAIIVCCPYLLFEIWRFIAPALYKREKKATKKAFLFASVLFYAGIVIGYVVVLPLMVNFFQGYQVSETVQNTISLSSYMATVYSTVLLFGLVFEFPTLIAILSQLGLVTKEMLKKGWRYAVCIVVILAALITPSGDPFSLCVVSVPLFILYWISISVCKSEAEMEADSDEEGDEEDEEESE